MKPVSSVRLLLVALSVGIFSCSSGKYAQSGTSEYDDMYFNKGDRYPIMTEGTTTVAQRNEPTDGGVAVGYNSKTLNPDYGLPQDAQTESEYQEDQYYVENHDDAYMDQAIDEYLRNNSTARRYSTPYYGNRFDDIFWSDPLFYQGTIFDPLYRSYYGVYSPFAYSPYYRPYSAFYNPWGPRWTVSIGFGFGYGSYWGRYYDPFYYGSGFGYGYGYRSPYTRYYYGSAWCPPSYYGGFNNTIVINNIETTNPGTVRYGTRDSRGSSYIVSNEIRERNTTDLRSNSRSIRSGADNTINRAPERTLNSRTIERDRTSDIRSRSVDQYNRVEPANSLDSRTNTYNLNERNPDSGIQQRSRTIDRDTYRTPERNINRSIDRRSYSTSPSRTSGSRYGNTPSREPASSGVRSRSNNSRSSSPSRIGSSNYGRSSSSGRVSSPSRSPSYSSSPSRISRPSSPDRSSSPPSRSSGRTRSISRD